MASNGSPKVSGDTENSLEKIKRQLASGSGKNLLQGPLLKRSETLRKWNERWVILDPTTGKMEYKTRRNDTVVKGTITFDSSSTITISPLNFQGLPKYNGCCFYVGTPQTKEYFLCAETPGAAKAWVSTLHATQLVLKAHKEAVNSLSGNGSTTFGTVATVLAAANSTALEASKEIEAAMRVSMRAALSTMSATKPNDDVMDDLSIMKETLRVKDEELRQLSRDLRARDSTIREIADKLTDTAQAAEAAASAAHLMDEERKLACAEVERLNNETIKQLEVLMQKLRDADEKIAGLNKNNELLSKQRDSALQEAHLWRSELGKAREHAVILEAAVLRADERARVAQADAEVKLKDYAERELAAAKEKEELLAYVNMLQAQIQRQEGNTKQVINEKSESCSGVDSSLPLTKHVDSSDDNVDKACLSDSRSVRDSGDGLVQVPVDRVDIRQIGDTDWSEYQRADDRVADVREILTEDGSGFDVPVVSPANNHHQPGGSSPGP